ncbi:MAG: Inner membrane protein RclC associated with response to reactive chlorine species, partial [uncultured Cytophagales bacterium]
AGGPAPGGPVCQHGRQPAGGRDEPGHAFFPGHHARKLGAGPGRCAVGLPVPFGAGPPGDQGPGHPRRGPGDGQPVGAALPEPANRAAATGRYPV